MAPAVALADVTYTGQDSAKYGNLALYDEVTTAPSGGWVGTAPSKSAKSGTYVYRTTAPGDDIHYGTYDTTFTFTVKDRVLTAVDMSSSPTTWAGSWGNVSSHSDGDAGAIWGYMPAGISMKSEGQLVTTNDAGQAVVDLGLEGSAVTAGKYTIAIDSVVLYKVANGEKSDAYNMESAMPTEAVVNARTGAEVEQAKDVNTNDSVADNAALNWNSTTKQLTVKDSSYNMVEVRYKIGNFFVFGQYVTMNPETSYTAAATDYAANIETDGVDGFGVTNRDRYTAPAYLVIAEKQLPRALAGEIDLDTVSSATKTSYAIVDALYAAMGYSSNRATSADATVTAASWDAAFDTVSEDLLVTLDGKAQSDKTTATRENGKYVFKPALTDQLDVGAITLYSCGDKKLTSEDLLYNLPKGSVSGAEKTYYVCTKNSPGHGQLGALSADEVDSTYATWDPGTKTLTINDPSVTHVVVGYSVGKGESGACGIAYSLEDLTAPAASTTPATPIAPAVVQTAQTVKLDSVAKSYTAAKVKSKAQSFTLKATGAKTAVSYAKTSGSGYLSVSKAGKVTVKKGTPAGTYSMKVKASAVASNTYKAASATATVKVSVIGTQNVKLSATSKSLKASSLKKSAKSFTVRVTSPSKKITNVKNVSTNKTAKKFTVKKSGTKLTVKVPKGTAKGTYSLKVKVSVPKVTGKYAAASTTKTIKVKVK